MKFLWSTHLLLKMNVQFTASAHSISTEKAEYFAFSVGGHIHQKIFLYCTRSVNCIILSQSVIGVISLKRCTEKK